MALLLGVSGCQLDCPGFPSCELSSSSRLAQAVLMAVVGSQQVESGELALSFHCVLLAKVSHENNPNSE